MFASGIGVQRDDARAARYYLAAATGGVPRAMFDLAVLYARGRGVLKDEVAAVAWCERAAIAGDAAACVNMAHVLGQGLVGRCPDSRAARRWLDLAARRRGSRKDDARDTAAAAHCVLRGLGARDTPGRTQVPHGQVRGDSTRVERGRLAQRENRPETIAQGDARGDTHDTLSRIRATGVDEHVVER